jgi:hypothetical protein
MLKAQNLLEVRKLFILGELFYASIPNVPRFPPEREDAVCIAAYYAQPRDRERLG